MDTEKKPFFKSKIVLLALTMIAVFGGNLLFGFVSGEVTPDQLASVEQAYPQVVEIVERLKNGETLLSVIGSVAGVLFLIFRAWLTKVSGISFIK